MVVSLFHFQSKFVKNSVSPSFYLWWSWGLKELCHLFKVEQLIGAEAKIVTQNLHLQLLDSSRYYTRLPFCDDQEPDYRVYT